MDKTKITHLGSEYAKFLGHYIRSSTLTQHISSRSRNILRRNIDIRKATGKPKLLVPLNDLKNKLIEKGMADVNGFPKFVGKFLYLSDAEIIRRYNSILRGFMNFYNLAENRSRLGELVYIIEFSLAHTLAAKHRLSLKKVFTKYGRPFKVKIGDNVIKTIMFDKPESLSANYLNNKYSIPKKNVELPFDPFVTMTYSIKETNILDKPCLICSSTDKVEMHHIKHLKDTKDKSTLIKVMSAIRRKVIPVCRSCHMKIHTGKYDGMNLKEILNKNKSE
jgi:hypothetical protein